MKYRISELLDGLPDLQPPLEVDNTASVERIKEATMKMIDTQEKKSGKRGRRLLIAALAAGLALTLTVGAGAMFHWTGFAFTKELSESEQDAIKEQAGAIHMELEDAQGNVHRYDSAGSEIEILPAEEAKEQTMEAIQAEQQKVRESTRLLDVDTMELIPHGITEVPVDRDGRFADFVLGNGYMILLYPQESSTYALKRGQSVTIGLTTDESCDVSFDLIRDGVMLEENMFVRSAPENAQKTVAADGRSLRYTYRFTIPEDGSYDFGVEYWSEGASTFRNCTLTIE